MGARRAPAGETAANEPAADRQVNSAPSLEAHSEVMAGGHISVVPDMPGVDLKPDPMAARSSQEFVMKMRELRIWAGKPPLRRMAALADGAFAHTTLSAALNSPDLPSLDLVVAFARVCGCTEAEVARWATSWRSIALRMNKARGGNTSTSSTRAPEAREDRARSFRAGRNVMWLD
jgi:hypothetical protein